MFQGNAELLSISSDDSIWNSEDEEDERQSDTGDHRWPSHILSQPLNTCRHDIFVYYPW